MRSLYSDGTYLTHNPDWHVQDSPWKARQILKMLQKHQLHPQTVCEVGCGAGEVLRQVQMQMDDNVHFTGYDISEQAIALANTRANDRLTFHAKDVLSETGIHFDLIMLIDIVEHIEDYYGFLRKLHPLADYFVVHLPLDLYVLSILRQGSLTRSRERYGHVHFFTRELALASLTDAGYQILDHFFTPTVDLPGKSVKARLIEYPRRLLYKLHPDLAAKLLGGYSLMLLLR